MKASLQSILKAMGTVLPTLLVLGALAGLGYWGAKTDWQVPKFSEIWAKPAAEEEPDPTIKIIQEKASQENADPCIRQFQGTQLIFPDKKEVDKAGIRCVPATSRTLSQYLTANGAVDYDQTLIAHLSTRAPGIVWRVDKHLGDHVKKGDVLALIESADVGRAKSDFLQYKVLLDIKKKVRAQLKSDVVPELKIWEAEAALQDARIKLLNAQQTLINLGFPVRIEDMTGNEEQLSEKVRFLGLPASLVKTLDKDITSSNLIPLVTPFNGVIVGRDIVTGEVVGTTQPQFTIADISHMWVLLDVRMEDTADLAIGQEITFRPEGMSSEAAHGKVSWISTEVDEKTRTVRVRAEIENSFGRFRAHTFGTGQILVRSIPNAVVVPDDAIQADEKCRMVFVRQGDAQFVTRLIQLGIRQDGFTQILSGVAPGEEVATIGSHALKSQINKDRIGEGD